MKIISIYLLALNGFTWMVNGLSVVSYEAEGFQETKCHKICPLGGEMVCGSDGNTYPSVCHLEKNSCEKKIALKVEHPGSCECPKSCQKNYKPLCGINLSTGKEKTYPNMCEFRKAACRKRIKFNRKGPCRKMSKCPAGCQDIFAPVCGSDNKTYSSVCSLKIAACRQNKVIRLHKIARCKPKACPENCPMTYQPICGSDGKLYPSECELKLSACRNRKGIEVVKRKKAKKLCGRKCVIYCPDDVAPVCGEDGQTYVNECKLMKKNCEKGLYIKVAKREKCGEISNNYSKKK